MANASPSVVTERRQIMLSFAYLTYCGDQIITPAPDAEIGDLIRGGMEQIPVLCTETSDRLVPNWNVVWGPVTYTTPGSLYQDSLMYVVQNRGDSSQYVIAIRGTNHKSDLDWLMDDFDVLQQMPWPPESSDASLTPMISESTSIALQVLLRMFDGTQTLLEYLDGVSESPIDLCVTGHSLGGCLASALGLHLVQSRGSWDKAGNSDVSCVTFAAPTAGNGDFATLVERSFSSTTFDRVQCNLDIVPLAWDSANIYTPANSFFGHATSGIFDIYDPQADGDPSVDFYEMSIFDFVAWREIVLKSMLPAARTVLSAYDYRQPFPDATQLNGSFYDPSPEYCAYDTNFASTSAAFQLQASYQHSGSYPTILDVPQLLDPNVINEIGSASGSGMQARRARSVLRQSLLVAAFDGFQQAVANVQGGPNGNNAPPER